MIILEHNYSSRNPWAEHAPNCVNGCPSGFVVAAGIGDEDDWWTCRACSEVFPN